MITKHRKIRIHGKRSGSWYSDVGLPKLFAEHWIREGVTHCDVEFDEKTYCIKLTPVMPSDN